MLGSPPEEAAVHCATHSPLYALNVPPEPVPDAAPPPPDAPSARKKPKTAAVPKPAKLPKVWTVKFPEAAAAPPALMSCAECNDVFRLYDRIRNAFADLALDDATRASHLAKVDKYRSRTQAFMAHLLRCAACVGARYTALNRCRILRDM